MADVSGTDPMTVAARPEPAAPSRPVHALGVGPGAAAFLTARGRTLLAGADVVTGFETVLEYVADVTDARQIACRYDDQSARLAAFADAVADGQDGVAVLMGDPNVSGYQFLGRVERAVDRPVRVVPGVSSVQVAASRARTPVEETAVVTLHRRGSLDRQLARLGADAGERHLLVIPRPYDWMPGDVAAHLLDAGVDPDLSAFVFERLTHDSEARTDATVGELATAAGGTDPEATSFSDLSVLVVRKDSAVARNGGGGRR